MTSISSLSKSFVVASKPLTFTISNELKNTWDEIPKFETQFERVVQEF